MKRKIAFICVHNSCRSQIAEALGRHLAGDKFDFIVRIREYPKNKNGKKKSVILD